ncbi:hypothetical protein AJ79_00227 [Helicocarpus griseus UAMH5409]|uniref:Uncharacterized protein n=1 Tax=Helicocarpus griseus UAMH5409 TaxID=1447875 RepID=A0A2B7Y3X8_9EURO|nr:hypothetical protein AJ79_00227 [Helicocarpus griseus UAMH5409]
MTQTDYNQSEETKTFLSRVELRDEAVNAIAESYDPDFDCRADITTYEHIPEDQYEDELERCGLSDELARRHMSPEDRVFREMQEPWYWAMYTLRTNIMIYEELMPR